MGFLNYLLLGAIAYGLGWAVRIYVLEKGVKPKEPYSMKHPIVIRYLALFFVFMLVVSALLGRFVIGHNEIDIPFIVVNSIVSTFVFSFGLSPDHVQHDLPD